MGDRYKAIRSAYYNSTLSNTVRCLSQTNLQMVQKWFDNHSRAVELKPLSRGVPITKQLRVAESIPPAKQLSQSLRQRSPPKSPQQMEFPEVAGKANLRTTIMYSQASQYRRSKNELIGKPSAQRKTFNCSRCGQPKNKETGHRQHKGRSFFTSKDGSFEAWKVGL